MVVLGLLARHGPQHGYQLRKLIEHQNIDRFSNVQLGSIYATLKRLTEAGLVALDGTEITDSRGPARSIHAITAPGRSHLEDLISNAFVSVDQPERPVDLALHLSSLLPASMVVALLERRLRHLERYQRGVQRLQAETKHPQTGVQELIGDIGDHFLALSQAEHEWTTRVLQRARQGGYRVRATGQPA
jgi:DNA-binding PadR family transcriptional regulator